MTAITLIQHLEVTGATATELEFTSIPQSYDELLLVCSLRTNFTPDTAAFLGHKVNGVSNTTGHYLYGLNTAEVASASPNGVVSTSTSLSNLFASNTFRIGKYSSTTEYKPIGITGIQGGSGGNHFSIISSATYTSNTAITSFAVGRTDSSLVQYSSATLYGLTYGSDGTTTVS